MSNGLNEKDEAGKKLIETKQKNAKFNINRNVLKQETVIKTTGYVARDKSIAYGLRQCWSNFKFLKVLTGLIPILIWLPKYRIKRDLPNDLIAGLTVAVMHIPQGLAYGILAGLSAQVGLYMAFFPLLVYVIFGTSKHISMGTFSVISILTLKVVQEHSTYQDNNLAFDEKQYTPLEVATALAVCVGFMHLSMGFLQLGALASLLNEPLVNGFTTASAVHVVVSQFKDILGVRIPKYKGAFKVIYTIIDAFRSVPQTNIVAVIFSVTIIILMILVELYLKSCFLRKFKFPLPIELIAVVGGTLISRYMHLGQDYNLTLVGEIPTGLPAPQFPPVELFPIVAPDAIAITIVSYSIVMSMGLIFAKKHSYEINANQELFAMGLANIVGGCFSCIPLSCSLSRSIIQDQTGGATQIASVVVAGLMLIVLLWIGPFFETLPKCVLAGIIIVAVHKMFKQKEALKQFSKQGKLEIFTWLITFFGVVFIDIDIGLLLGFIVSLMSFYIKGLKPYGSLIGTSKNPQEADIYVELKNHNAIEVPHIKIYRYCGSINFATKNSFKKKLYKEIEVDYERLNRKSFVATDGTLLRTFDILILDLSGVGHLDIAGCKALTEIRKDMEKFNAQLFLAAPTNRVYDTLIHSMGLGEGPFEIFPTLHDSVLYANESIA